MAETAVIKYKQPTKHQREQYLKLVPKDSIDQAGYINLVVDQLFSSATRNKKKPRAPTLPEIELAFHKCQLRQLNPLLNEIYFIYRYDKTIDDIKIFEVVGIEGLRAQADRTGLYVGSTAPKFKYDKKDPTETVSCEMTVFRLNPKTGDGFPTSALVFMKEYLPYFGHVGKTMPRNQLAKVAEAQCLKKAFRLGQIYIAEELPAYDIGLDKADPDTVSKTLASAQKFIDKHSKSKGRK